MGVINSMPHSSSIWPDKFNGLKKNNTFVHMMESKLKNNAKQKIQEIKENYLHGVENTDYITTFKINALNISNYDFDICTNKLYYLMMITESDIESISHEIDKLNKEFLGYICVEYGMSNDKGYLLAII